MERHRAVDAPVGKIQRRYGIGKEEAEKQVHDWTAKLPPKPEAEKCEKRLRETRGNA